MPMPSSTIMVLSSSFTILITTFFLSIFAGHAARVPFRYSLDVPKQIARPICNISGDLENGGYYHVATLYPFATKYWHGECFDDNHGYVTYNRDGGLGYVVITASNGKSWTCSDYYEFKARGQTIATDSIYFGGIAHETVFDSHDRELRRSIKHEGVSVYLYKSNILKEPEGTFEDRSQSSRVAGVNVDVIHHGDEGKEKAFAYKIVNSVSIS